MAPMLVLAIPATTGVTSTPYRSVSQISRSMLKNPHVAAVKSRKTAKIVSVRCNRTARLFPERSRSIALFLLLVQVQQ